MFKYNVEDFSKCKTTHEIRDRITNLFNGKDEDRIDHLPYPLFPSMYDIRPYKYRDFRVEGKNYLIPVWHFSYLDLQFYNEYDTEITSRDREKYINEWDAVFNDNIPIEFKINYAGLYLHNYPYSTRVLRIKQSRVLFADNKIHAIYKLTNNINYKFNDTTINMILDVKQINTPSNFKKFKHLLNGKIERYRDFIQVFEDENMRTLDMKLNYLALGKYDLIVLKNENQQDMNFKNRFVDEYRNFVFNDTFKYKPTLYIEPYSDYIKANHAFASKDIKLINKHAKYLNNNYMKIKNIEFQLYTYSRWAIEHGVYDNPASFSNIDHYNRYLLFHLLFENIDKYKIIYNKLNRNKRIMKYYSDKTKPKQSITLSIDVLDEIISSDKLHPYIEYIIDITMLSVINKTHKQYHFAKFMYKRSDPFDLLYDEFNKNYKDIFPFDDAENDKNKLKYFVHFVNKYNLNDYTFNIYLYVLKTDISIKLYKYQKFDDSYNFKAYKHFIRNEELIDKDMKVRLLSYDEFITNNNLDDIYTTNKLMKTGPEFIIPSISYKHGRESLEQHSLRTKIDVNVVESKTQHKQTYSPYDEDVIKFNQKLSYLLSVEPQIVNYL